MTINDYQRVDPPDPTDPRWRTADRVMGSGDGVWRCYDHSTQTFWTDTKALGLYIGLPLPAEVQEALDKQGAEVRA